MAFKFLNKQGCESSEGFSVQITGRFTIEYREGHKVIEIPWEAGKDDATNKFVALVSTSSFSCWLDGSDVDNPEDKIRKFKEAMKFIDLEAVFE